MLQIRMLGKFDVLLDGQALAGFGPQLRRLLARLCLDGNRTIEHSRLLRDLWPESESTEVVRKSLQRLRSLLGSEERRLKAENSTASLDITGLDLDLTAFAERIDRGTPEALASAVKLYSGMLLEDWEDFWITAAREDCEINYLDALKGLAAADMETGNWLRAAYYLRRFVNSCREMEWGWETLLEAYIQGNNRVQALETYQIYVDYLRRAGAARNVSLKPSLKIENLVQQLSRQEQQSRVAEIRSPEPPTSPAITDTPLESAGGAVPFASPYYVARTEDSLLYSTLALPAYTLLIKGPRQIGKSSLMARALHQARKSGACVLLTDWQNMTATDLESADSFFMALAYAIVDQLDLDVDPADAFLAKRPPSSNFERFLRRMVFPTIDQPIVWGIDEADRLFASSFCDDVFGKLRSWHNERALAPEGPWRRFSIVLAYSTEANLFIQNMNQSPFNVGTRIALHDFTAGEARELNRRYRSPVDEGAGMERLLALLGGHPYLLRRSLEAIQQRELTLGDLDANAERDDGLFCDHLERMRFALQMDENLTDAVRAFLRKESVPSQIEYVRLCSAGIMIGSSPGEMRPRCELYGRYLRRHLL